MNDKYNLFMPALVLGISLVLSTIIFAGFWNKRAKTNQTITVTGSAKRVINSDVGILRGNLQATGATAEEAYKRLQAQRPTVFAYLKQQGFEDKAINQYTINLNPVFELSIQGYPTNRVLEYNANQQIEIKSKDVAKIKRVSLDITSLVNKGVSFSVNPPEYYYTKLADIKIDIQADAAKDALNRAQKIASATGSSLGPISNARMGVLQITPVNSNIVSDYGVNDVSSIEKEITAVVNASFRLE
ncbi:SIMPL domain-containing protein [Pontibacter vulgaris]|uniref:SIMPL domain-containing protein n=1 Tax=Pontibacter vulgaris TaxID=2905679 RepID=UPI001FA79A9B|nr:SIMPL domain-containing protein [Pontibacter vulgaris]